MKTHERYYVRWASGLPRAPNEAPVVFNDLQDGLLDACNGLKTTRSLGKSRRIQGVSGECHQFPLISPSK